MQGRNVFKGTIRMMDAQLPTITFLPMRIQISDDRKDTVAMVSKLIHMGSVEGTLRLDCKMQFSALQVNTKKSAQPLSELVHHTPIVQLRFRGFRSIQPTHSV